ncbi:MAG: hypothetical protein ACTSUD_08970 [Alphaproteobacteria bacterium]
MLGLTQTVGATPMLCRDGRCTAELSAFCLQKYRDPPRVGTAYKAVDPSRIVLSFTLADGSVIRKSARGLVRLSSIRSHFAVRLSLPRQVMASMGATSVSVSVGAKVSLAPKPVAGDKRPQSRAEIAATAGGMRATAVPITDGNLPNAVAARVVNRMINTLPRGDQNDPRWRVSLWKKVLAETKLTARTANGIDNARAWHRLCLGYPRSRGAFASCLQLGHDRFMGKINKRYWNVVGAGT